MTTSVFVSIAAFVTGVMRIGQGRPLVVGVALVAGLLLASLPLLLRRTGSVALVGNLLLGVLWVGVTGSNLGSGGAVLGMLLASLLIPMLALLLLSVRQGWIWGALTLVQLTLAPLLPRFGFTPFIQPPAAVRELMILVAPPTTMLLAIGIAVAFRRFEAASAAEISRSQREAEQANEAKSHFLATMSHELRTPLNGVVGALALLRLGQLSSEQLGHVEIAAQSAETLLVLIGNILDLAAIEAGTLVVEERAFHLGDEIRGSAEALRGLATSKSLALRVEIAPELDTQVLGDRRRVRQLVTNLLGNALKYTQEGEVGVALRSLSEESFAIAISDTGPGIAPELEARLFQSYVRGSNVAGVSGAGLGLAIVQEVVTRMRGRVSVETELGRGSTFTLELPLSFPPERSADAVPEPGAPAPTTSRRVLLVEDNRINQVVIGALLEALGHSVELASDGEQGVARWTAGSFDCVLMDREMPKLDGLGATRRIRALERERGLPSTPIIALTANVLRSDQGECLAAGMDDYLTKPIDVDALAAALGRL